MNTQPTPLDAERERFEKTYAPGGNPEALRRKPTGQYVNDLVQSRWMGWQARSQLATPATPATPASPVAQGEPVAMYQQASQTVEPSRYGSPELQALILQNLTQPVSTAPVQPAAVGAVQAKYEELLYAVASKYPNESRHQTALRYIQSAENRVSNGAALASKGAQA